MRFKSEKASIENYFINYMHIKHVTQLAITILQQCLLSGLFMIQLN